MRIPGLFSHSLSRSPGRAAAVLFGLGCLVVPRLSAAHIMLAPPPATPFDWLKPNSEGDPQKIPPCGADPAATTTYTPSNKINMVTVGDKLTINWIETVPHDGHFRIALAASRADLTDPATVPNTPNDGTAKSAAISTAYPVLADGLFEHLASSVSAGKTYSYTITIPNMPCAKCTLQLLQFMANHPLDPTEPGTPGTYFYHHCADMMILAAPTGAGGTTGGGAGVSGSAGTGGGAGVSGGAGTSGNAGSNGAGGVTGSGTAGVTGSGTAGVTGSGTAGVTGSGTAGVTGNGTAGVTGSSGTAGVTGSGTAGTGVASGTGGSSGGTGTAPTSGCGCQTAGRTAGLGAFGLCAIALLVGRRARRARRR